MHIEVDTAHMTFSEATGLVALILSIFPNAHRAPDTVTIGAIESARVVQVGASALAEMLEEEAEIDPAAAFAPDPAQAFGDAPIPPAATPAVAPPPIVPASSAVELDKNGLPWDARIHASTKARNADETWRNKRGVSADTVAAVTAELRAVLAAPGPSVAAPPSPPPVSVPLAAAPPPPVSAPTPPTPAIAPTISQPAATDFPGIMRKVTGAQSAGQLTTADVSRILGDIGLNALRDLVNRPDLIPTFSDQVDAYIASA